MNKSDTMKKVLLFFSTIFLILSIAGSIYVRLQHGEANSGCAVVPMILMLACQTAFWKIKTTE